MPVPSAFDSPVARSVRLQRNRTWRAPVIGSLAEEMSHPVGVRVGLSMLRRLLLRDLENAHYLDDWDNGGRPT